MSQASISPASYFNFSQSLIVNPFETFLYFSPSTRVNVFVTPFPKTIQIASDYKKHKKGYIIEP